MSAQHFTPEEAQKLPSLVRQLARDAASVSLPGDFSKLRKAITDSVEAGCYARNRAGINTVMHNLETSRMLCELLSPDRNMILAVMLFPAVHGGTLTIEELTEQWGDDVARLVGGRMKVAGIYGKQSSVESDNFRKLLLTFAEDIRVIIIMIIDRLVLMRAINHHPNERMVRDIATESSYLYAPLAHRLGLYKIKGELEDLSLKYTNRDIYTKIAHELNQTKDARDRYIAEFIAPVKKKLEATGLKFEIKGRTKSISSIRNKLRKQQIELKDVYDLFAIRIILDVPEDREKAECWNVYSIIADMYTPNPARLKDWLSIPKSNGYESLHTTVQGPGNRWVEVQIRTRRMDLIAEKGLAAHWKYKGIKSEGNLDTWMNNIRDILEAGASSPMELMKDFKMDLYDKEVFVFTPKGDLYKLPFGATVLDFAFHIHSRLGCSCVGARINGRNQKLNRRLESGDTVEILTSGTQTPRADWLNFVVTSKARSKIRQALNERANRAADIGKETFQRRAKNRKRDIDEGLLMRLIKKLGYKTVTDFYSAIGEEHLDAATVLMEYDALEHKEAEQAEKVSAEEFMLQTQPEAEQTASGSSDTVVIGEGIKGINYKLARCCNPIYGDDVFGFISAEGVIKIHRKDCPNARHIIEKYPYRLIRTRWSGKAGEQFGATLSVVGNDDIGIVTNITSIITKERNVTLRNISIDSHDGLFRGYLVVGVTNTEALDNIIRKLKTVKGVKNVQRSN